MYRKTNVGARTELWETPALTESKLQLSTATVVIRSDRKLLITEQSWSAGP